MKVRVGAECSNDHTDDPSLCNCASIAFNVIIHHLPETQAILQLNEHPHKLLPLVVKLHFEILDVDDVILVIDTPLVPHLYVPGLGIDPGCKGGVNHGRVELLVSWTPSSIVAFASIHSVDLEVNVLIALKPLSIYQLQLVADEAIKAETPCLT